MPKNKPDPLLLLLVKNTNNGVKPDPLLLLLVKTPTMALYQQMALMAMASMELHQQWHYNGNDTLQWRYAAIMCFH